LRRGAVDELYAIINSLNVHKHHAFKTIAFSDTLIVYNIYETDTPDNRRYHVMYMCEFAQDLFYRLVPRDLHFRAFLTKGEFEHQQLDNLQAFYGEALVAAYRREKTIDCTGLFIDAPILPDCAIFHYERYDAVTYFIHLMQSLDQTRFKDVTFPLDPILIEESHWELAYDFRYLKNIYGHMNNPELEPRIRAKHSAAWNLIRRRHRPLLYTLEVNDFNPQSISNFDWAEAIRHVDSAHGVYGP
jgi:hypothetical protein